jgi:hypothetical protein
MRDVECSWRDPAERNVGQRVERGISPSQSQLGKLGWHASELRLEGQGEVGRSWVGAGCWVLGELRSFCFAFAACALVRRAARLGCWTRNGGLALTSKALGDNL